MRYLSLFSGIEAASVAWMSLEWEPVAFAEIEPFPCAVLAHHYPDVPNLGNVKEIDGRQFNGVVDLVVGGTPCQDFSIAGQRAGIAGERSGLVSEFARLLHEVHPKWFVWENVPGVFSLNKGRDFARILALFQDCGYCCAWRVLDAQFFGVPQRRRRVFVVGYSGDWRPAATVLFESESVCGNFAQGNKKRENIAASIAEGAGRNGQKIRSHWEGGPHPCLAYGVKSSGGIGRSNQELFSQGGANLVASYIPKIVEQAISCKWAKGSSGPAGDEHHNLITYAPQIAPSMSSSGPPYERTGNERVEADALICSKYQVRRLTCRECERLMGFPDDYTAIEYKGKSASDSNRYKALGNSMAVPVMKWIGERIKKLEGGPFS